MMNMIRSVVGNFVVTLISLIIFSCSPESAQDDDGTSIDSETTSSAPETVLSSDASLFNLTIDGVELDQIFQPLQNSYTGSVNFLTTHTSLTPVTNNSTAAITIDGMSVASGSDSGSIKLSEGDNTITVSVTAEDGISVQSYTLDIYRATADEFGQQIYLKASSAGNEDYFGYSVAIDGDTMVVGAYGEDSNSINNETNDSASNSGAVYVFTRNGSSWTQQAYLKASNAEADDVFGHSVAVSGDTVVVGAYGEDSEAIDDEANNSAPNSGAVYVFTRDGNSWSQQFYLKANSIRGSDSFGYSVAVDGDTLVVGALGESSGTIDDETDISAKNAGAAYVFTRDGVDWAQQGYLKASNAEADDSFGNRVAVDGDTVVVAAQYEDSSSSDDETDNNANSAGAVYIFTRESNSWLQQAYLKASKIKSSHYFGSSIAIDEDTLVIGATGDSSNSSADENDNTAAYSGAAYVFSRIGNGWTQQAYLKASNPNILDWFGHNVDIDGDTLVVGATYEKSSTITDETDNTTSGAGAAYVFTRGDDGWIQQAYLKASNADESDYFGYGVAVSGDTVVIGAYQESSSADGGEADNSTSKAGAVYVWQ